MLTSVMTKHLSQASSNVKMTELNKGGTAAPSFAPASPFSSGRDG